MKPRFGFSPALLTLTSCRWDDWVSDDRIRKINEENIDLKLRLDGEVKRQQQELRRAAGSLSGRRKSGHAESILDSEDRSSTAAGPRGTKRNHETFIERVGLSRPTCSNKRANDITGGGIH